MVVLAAGKVVLVPFPFSDLSQSKVRPAICLASAGRGDWILCQVTSNPYGDPDAIPLSPNEFFSGGLLTLSCARPGKLFTAHESLVSRSVATLTSTALDALLVAVTSIIRPAQIP